MKTKYLIPALLLLFLAGCYKEQTPVEEGSVPRKGTFNFSSSTGEVTKVLLNSDNTLFWAAGDKIAVYDYKAGGSLKAKDIAVLTGGEGTAVGTFTPSTLPVNTSWYDAGDASDQQYNFYAYYPGGNSAPAPDAGNVTVSVAASQEEAAGIGKYIVSWASANTTKQSLAGDSAPNFAFTPKSALLKLALQNNTSHASNITQITITATGGNIAGNASLTLASGALTAGASNVITYTPASPIQIAPNSTLSVPVYVSVLPCNATNLAIYCTESEGVYGNVNIAMSSIASGKVYSKTAVLSSFESQRFVIANPTDQSAKSSVLEENNLYYGKANCVLVTDIEHTTSFNVNIQLFKTTDGYTRSAASASPFTSAVTSAKIIWTEGGLSSDANFKITGGDLSKITLSKTKGTTGNALVGIYDADGRVLWSYHIWAPNDASVNTPGGSHSGKYAEAFNLALGQIDTPNEPYMCYQWGRKDPLGRAANMLSSSPGLMATSGDGPSESKLISALATGHSGNNLAYARQNPMVYITQNDDKLYDWYPTTSGTTRTDGNKPAGQNDNLWKDTTVGSIYDPCPEGYHVPGNNNLWHDAQGKTYSSETKSWAILNFQYVLCGSRYCTNAGVNNVAANGHFWASEVVGGSSQNARDLHYNGSAVHPTDYSNRANGFGVRCVK